MPNQKVERFSTTEFETVIDNALSEDLEELETV
jgi:hypothetical protein